MEIAIGMPTAALTSILPAPNSPGGLIGNGQQVPAATQSAHSAIAERQIEGLKRTLWDHSATQDFIAIDTNEGQWQVYIEDQLWWNNDFSCTATDTWHYNLSGGWGAPYSTGGGTCWIAWPPWDPGNRWDTTTASASWSTSNFNAYGACQNSGTTTIYWWTQLYGRGSSTALNWNFSPGGVCGSYLTPVIP